MRWVLALGLLAGCDKIVGIGEVGKIDAGVDGKIYLDAPPAGTVCAGVAGAPLHICAQEATLQGLSYSSNVDLDTDVDAMCTRVDPASGRQGALCLIIATDLSIEAAATLHAHGSRPLVLVAMRTLTLDGTVDVSSHTSPAFVGAGADDAACIPANGPIQGAGGSSSGGGAGGSFGTRGGNGGAATGTGAGLFGSMPVDPAMLLLVRGGCRGGNGGTDHSGHTASGGHSGGAVYLMAGTMLAVGGAVLANGASGGAGASSLSTDYPGGAGGGAGGLIMLDTPSLALGGLLMASGGGGGAGQSDLAAGGKPGAEPAPASPTMAAPGGVATGDTTGGAGGAGSTQDAPTNGGAASGVGGSGITGAGGGGGGGAGVIRIFGATATSGTIVPAAT